MSTKIIELNDRAISVGDESGILLQSPGFALASGQEVVLGEQAEKQARLQPTASYNKYWHELNLDPLNHNNDFRHYADIAYAHLMHLAEVADISSDVILAVPGSFSRQQLAIMLGLTKHSPFTVTGVVDSAVAAAISSVRSKNILYADMQLHQVVLTRLSVVDEHLHSESTVQIPGVGSQNFMDLMMQMATGMFIQQCRFNPQHNAESEQQLYNELPNWLAQSEDGNLILELKAGTTVHTAKMPLESLISSLNNYFKKINEQIAAMATERDTQLVINPALAQLPGFSANLSAVNDLMVLDQAKLFDACLSYRDLIASPQDNIQLVKRLPLHEETAQQVNTAAASEESPTHVLHGSTALPVENLQIKNQQAVNGSGSLPGSLVLSIAGKPDVLGNIQTRKAGVFFHSESIDYEVNGIAGTGENKLAVGDRLQLAGGKDILTMIRVHNGQ